MSEEIMLGYKKSLLNYCDRQTYVKMVVCGILGYSENNMYHQLVGEFYDNYLKENYLATAIEEFQISPMVERLLTQMSKEEQTILANNLFCYIQNIVENYKNEDYESATLMFVYMNSFLRNIMKNLGVLAIDKELDEIKNDTQKVILKKAM